MAAFSRFIWVPRSLRDRRGGAALPRQPEASRRAAAYYEELGREPAGSIRKESARAPPCVRVLAQEGTRSRSACGREICKRLPTVRNIRWLPGNAQKISRLRSGHSAEKNPGASRGTGSPEKTRLSRTGIRSDHRTA